MADVSRREVQIFGPGRVISEQRSSADVEANTAAWWMALGFLVLLVAVIYLIAASQQQVAPRAPSISQTLTPPQATATSIVPVPQATVTVPGPAVTVPGPTTTATSVVPVPESTTTVLPAAPATTEASPGVPLPSATTSP